MNQSSWRAAGGVAPPPQVLWEDGERRFCRVWRTGPDGGPVPAIAVSPAAERPGAEIAGRLAHEWALREHLDGEWALRPLELVRERGETVLVLEHHDGEPLDRLLSGRLETGRFLRLAVALGSALARLHERGLVHRDVKPANVLVDAAGDRVRLTGFGLATRLPRERPPPEPPESLAGTLAYMSPEQTGRMNRSVDSRSDLYSLGVTLYRALTGSLPFTASDPMEWVHCHVAGMPPPPGARAGDVPPQLAAVVMKLLAKTPEERYQTAAGATRDLRRCLADWEARGDVGEFPPGERDVPDRLLVPERLYGREREVAALLAAFDRTVRGGPPGLVLVRGLPGIGKSSVVGELHRVLVPPRGLFASGKFDRLKRDVPYATLAQALRGLVRRLLARPEAELGLWRDRLREALDPNGALVVGLVPELELVIGEQPPVPDAPPAEARARFQLALRRLVGVFARPEHPLALFLDDLQWLDAATLDLLEGLLVRPELRHLLVVGAYRDDEVDAAHPLARTLAAIREAGAPVQEIALAPLKPRDLARLVADALHCEARRAAPLARLVHAKTGGNPFFAGQLIRELAGEGSVRFDPGAAGWVWDLERIRARGHTDNVAELMAGKLGRLPPATRRALAELACLGNAAPASTLAIVHEAPEEELHAVLWDALRLELVVRPDDSYRFAHDRVQEAAYSLVPEVQRPAAHLRIGRLLSRFLPPDRREEAVFEIAGQLNRGSALIDSREERDELAELNLIAGRRAKAAAAYAAALGYLAAGAALVGDDGWERRRGLVFDLELQRAECEMLTGDVPAAKERLLDLSRRAADAVERAAVACLLNDAYIALRRLDLGIEACLDCLRRAGLDFPARPTREQAQAAYDRLGSKLAGRSVEELADLPPMTDPAARATLSVLARAANCAMTTDRDLFCLVICAAVELSLEHGNHDASCYAYQYFAIVSGWHFGDIDAGFRFGRLGHELVRRPELRRFEALVCMLFGAHVVPWSRHVAGAAELQRRAFEVGARTGDHVSAVASRGVLVSGLLLAGEPLAGVEGEVEAGLEFCERAGFADFVDNARIQGAFVRGLRGRTRRFGSFDGDGFDEARMEAHFASQPHLVIFECWYWVRRLQALVLAGEHAAALDAADRARGLLWATPALLEEAEFELYAALAHAAACDSASADERRRHLEALASHHARLALWARHCPDNWESRAALAAAEAARLEGRDGDAMRLYEQAVRSALDGGFVHVAALAAELAAGFYAGRGVDRVARDYLRDARHGYLRWGADGKARQLEERFPWLRDGHPRPDPALTVRTPVEQLELGTVLRFLQLMYAETDLETLLASVMRLALEHAGAERGLLLLPAGDEFRVEAEAGASAEGVEVALRRSATTGELPEPVLRYAVRTGEAVLLHDAAAENPFPGDEYLRRSGARSVLCMPLLKQARLVGVIYLENRLAPGVFTPARTALLRVLASGAAISLENARLLRDLREREARVRRLVDSNIVGIVIWHADGRVLEANDEFLRIVGYDREELLSGRVRWTDLTPPEWHGRDGRALEEIREAGAVQAHEREYVRRDGGRVPVLAAGAVFEGAPDEGVAFVLDLTERRRAEQALRDSERESRLIVDTIPGSVALLTATGEVDVVNRQLLEYFGRTLEELKRWRMTDVVHPEDLPHVAEAFTAAIAAGTPYRIVQRFQRWDGVYRWFENSGFPICDAEGRIVRWCVLLTDVHERKRAEEALAASERRLKLTVDTIPALAWATGPDGSADYFNQHYLDFVGLSAEQAAGWGWTTALHPGDRDALAGVWLQLLAAGEPGEAEARLRRHDGEYRWFLFRASPLRDDTGAIVKWYGVNTDIEDRKRAEAELRRAYDSFADAQRLSKTGSFITDLVGDDHNWSRETYRIFGFDPATRVTVQRIRDTVLPEDLPPFDAMIARAVSGENVSFSFRIATAGGGVKHVRGVAHVVEQVEGRPMFVGALQDVTETVVAGEALDRARSELAHVARVTALSTLTASIAHEVNQPLSGIVTNASTCLRMLDVDPPDLEGARETAKRTIRDGHRASDVITRLRALFSKKEFTLEPVDLNEAIREVVALSSGDLQRNRVILRSELADDLPPVTGDRVQLQQVVLNLLLNAVEAMSRVEDRPRRLLVRTEREEGGRARVTVRDSGAGVDPAHLDKLFDAFYTTKTGGMGIGLSVSRSIVERHHGRLRVEANDGPGAAFTFSIPCRPGNGADAPSTPRTP